MTAYILAMAVALAALAALAAGRRRRAADADDAARLDRRLAALRPEVTHVQGR